MEELRCSGEVRDPFTNNRHEGVTLRDAFRGGFVTRVSEATAWAKCKRLEIMGSTSFILRMFKHVRNYMKRTFSCNQKYDIFEEFSVRRINLGRR